MGTSVTLPPAFLTTMAVVRWLLVTTGLRIELGPVYAGRLAGVAEGGGILHF
jgi:hypothetical protein